MLVLAAVALLCLTAGAAGAWTAYNDVVCRVNQPAPLANVTSWNIGNNHPDPTSGLLKNFATGASVGVTASLTQNTAVSSVVWQSGDAPYPNNTTAGSETNSGTDAYNSFTAVGVLVMGLVYYGGTGWWVDLTLTGLNSGQLYEFATTANRNGSTYAARISNYTLSGADAFTNASTSGTTILDGGATTQFCTGYNTVTGYVARWTNINPGADGTFKIRALAGTAEYRAYAFSVFSLKEVVPEPSSIVVLGMGVAALLGRRKLRK
jgi:hypothetical protein